MYGERPELVSLSAAVEAYQNNVRENVFAVAARRARYSYPKSRLSTSSTSSTSPAPLDDDLLESIAAAKERESFTMKQRRLTGFLRVRMSEKSTARYTVKSRSAAGKKARAQSGKGPLRFLANAFGRRKRVPASFSRQWSDRRRSMESTVSLYE